jgi:hypothetical protein
MAAAAAELSAELARKAHLDALNRDYVVEPHLGECVGPAFVPERTTRRAPPSALLTPALAPLWHTHKHPHQHTTEYRTVAGVSGPLVVVECVKK